LERTKTEKTMKKSFKLVAYLLLAAGTFIVSCEHCDEGDADNQAVYQSDTFKATDSTFVD